MQESFSFSRPDLDRWRELLGPVALPAQRRTAIGQLVKSSISARTRDAVSLSAYRALGRRYPSAAALAQAGAGEVARVIAAVTFADAKATHLVAALRQIAREDGGFDLSHLAHRPLGEALAWLERLPGVARKVAASTLNASRLGRPVMIVDTHVLRVLQRLEVVGASVNYRIASEAVTGAMPAWRGDDFLGFHVALKRLGQEVCRWDAPVCEMCPLAGVCPGAAMAGVARRGS
ncbi:endonuclease III domain-containing protein [Sphingomonas adhaesiva]|uniref:endonuclease III domain-containing protein n=1 Tax=Sphingomonas adhaesiva TaxID=28212 RepID=UPI002FF98781